MRPHYVSRVSLCSGWFDHPMPNPTMNPANTNATARHAAVSMVPLRDERVLVLVGIQRSTYAPCPVSTREGVVGNASLTMPEKCLAHSEAQVQGSAPSPGGSRGSPDSSIVREPSTPRLSAQAMPGCAFPFICSVASSGLNSPLWRRCLQPCSARSKPQNHPTSPTTVRGQAQRPSPSLLLSRAGVTSLGRGDGFR